MIFKIIETILCWIIEFSFLAFFILIPIVGLYAIIKSNVVDNILIGFFFFIMMVMLTFNSWYLAYKFIIEVILKN